jgi:hypothetical protein
MMRTHTPAASYRNLDPVRWLRLRWSAYGLGKTTAAQGYGARIISKNDSSTLAADNRPMALLTLSCPRDRTPVAAHKRQMDAEHGTSQLKFGDYPNC